MSRHGRHVRPSKPLSYHLEDLSQSRKIMRRQICKVKVNCLFILVELVLFIDIVCPNRVKMYAYICTRTYRTRTYSVNIAYNSNTCLFRSLYRTLVRYRTCKLAFPMDHATGPFSQHRPLYNNNKGLSHTEYRHCAFGVVRCAVPRRHK